MNLDPTIIAASFLLAAASVATAVGLAALLHGRTLRKGATA